MKVLLPEFRFEMSNLQACRSAAVRVWRGKDID